MTDDSYRKYLLAMARTCRQCPVCGDVPCAGCMAGGVCDDLPCQCEDEYADEYDHEDEDDCEGGL